MGVAERMVIKSRTCLGSWAFFFLSCLWVDCISPAFELLCHTVSPLLLTLSEN